MCSSDLVEERSEKEDMGRRPPEHGVEGAGAAVRRPGERRPMCEKWPEEVGSVSAMH